MQEINTAKRENFPRGATVFLGEILQAQGLGLLWFFIDNVIVLEEESYQLKSGPGAKV